jgi:hypothetical protein
MDETTYLQQAAVTARCRDIMLLGQYAGHMLQGLRPHRCQHLQDGAAFQQAMAKVSMVCVSDVFVLCELLQEFINMDEQGRQHVVIIDGLGSLLYSLQGGSSHHHRGVL